MARRRAQAGQPVRISAGDYNDAVDAGQWFAQQRALGRGGVPLSVPVNPCVVRVRNDSGGDLTAGSVVEIGSATVTLQRVALRFAGDERSGYDPVFGVLLESIPNGKYGDCQLAGVCMADIDIQDEDNTHGRVVSGSITLEGHSGGWVRIIHKPSGTGVKKCAVMLGHQARPLRWARTTTNSDYPDYPDNGPTYVVAFGDCVASPSPVPGTSSSPSFTAFSPAWKEIAVDPDGGTWDEGSIVRVERHDDGQWWIRPKAAASGSTVTPLSLYGSNYYLTSGASYPRGGSYGATEYWTLGYPYVSGPEADNNVEVVAVGAAGDHFLKVNTSGYYLISLYCTFAAYFTGTTTATATTSTNSGHNHTVSTYAGAGRMATVQSSLWYRTADSGSYTNVVSRSALVGYAITEIGPPYANNTPPGSMSKTIGVNLTAGWRLQQRLHFGQNWSTTDHQLDQPGCQMLIQYLGDTQTEASA